MDMHALDSTYFAPGKHPRDGTGRFSESSSSPAVVARLNPPASSGNRGAKSHTFAFKVGGVNSEPETIYVTAASFRKAAYEACLNAANGKKKDFHRTWVKPLSVNGHDISRYDTIEGERFSSDQNIDRTEDAVRRLLSNQHNQSGGNDRESNPQKPVSVQTRGSASYGSGGQSGLVLRYGDGKGNVRNRDGQLHRQIPSEPSQVRIGRYVDVRPDGSVRQSSGNETRVIESSGSSDQNDSKSHSAKPSQMMFSFDHACAMDAYPRKKSFFRELIRSLSDIAKAGEEDKGNASNAKHPRTEARGRGRVGANVRIDETRPADVSTVVFKPKPSFVREMIKGNCDLITTVPHGKKLNGIENRIKRLFENTTTTKGTLQRYLEKGCGLLPYQAKRIIDDQIIKYNARMQLEDFKRQGVKIVRWCPGECEHHRPSHVTKWPSGLAGCVFPIDHPPTDPATGRAIYPGDEINCHCYLEAVE